MEGFLVGNLRSHATDRSRDWDFLWIRRVR
jgi:hypothetical protein